VDLQKIATYGSAVAVVGTGTVVGGNVAIDHATGGPEKRIKAEATELRLIVREEVRSSLLEAWPKQTGPVVGETKKVNDYRKEILSK